MLYNTLKEIKEELSLKGVSCKIKNHQKTLVIEAKENSFLVDKNDGRFTLTVFENIDYEITAEYKNISGFEVIKIIKNIIGLSPNR